MIRRHRRVVPATIVAVVLLAAMVAIIASCVQVLLGQPPLIGFADLAAQGAALRWVDVVVLIAGAILAVLGVILLACAWSPGKPTVLPLASADPQHTAGATRHSLRRTMINAAEGVDGVRHATAVVTPRRIRTTVTTSLRDDSGLSDRVRTAVGERLTAIALDRPPRIDVRVNHARSS